MGQNFFQFDFVEKNSTDLGWALFYLRRSKKTDREQEIAGMSDGKTYRFAAGTGDGIAEGTSDGKTYQF